MVVLDSDGQHDPAEIPQMLALLNNDEIRFEDELKEVYKRFIENWNDINLSAKF